MMVYFADRKMNIIGYASTNLPDGIYIDNDMKTEEVDVGVAIFECSLPFNESNRETVERYGEVGNYILRSNNDETEFYTIIESELDTKTQELTIYAEDAGLDLLNEVVEPYTADKAYPASFYIEKFAYDSGFEIGLNEISNLTRTLKWEGRETATSRLLSVATEFDNAEISFSFKIDRLKITNKYINLHKKRGNTEVAELRLNRDINSIVTSKSIANLATCFRVSGGTPEGSDTPISLNGYNYDDGDFYVSGSSLYSRKALEKWSRYQWEKGINDVGHIVKTFNYETTSQSELCNRALTELKKICDVEVNYEVDITNLPKNAKIGDTVNIVDNAGKLYLTSRILKLETSICNQTSKATLGDFLIKENGLSEKLTQLAADFKDVAKSRTLYTWTAYADDALGNGIALESAGKKYIGISVNNINEMTDISDPSKFKWSLIKGEDSVSMYILSSNGTTFKNSVIETKLTVVIFYGNKAITNKAQLIEAYGDSARLDWGVKHGDRDIEPVIPNDSHLSDDGFSYSLGIGDVDEKAIFQVELFAKKEVRAKVQQTILDLNDGFSVMLSLNSYTFQGTTNAAKVGDCTTKVMAYQGERQVPCTVTKITTPTGISVSNNNDLNAPTLTITSSPDFIEDGVVEIYTSINNTNLTIVKKFAVSIAFTGEQGENGEDAIVLKIDSINGYMFKNSEVSTTLVVQIFVRGNIIDNSKNMYEYFGNQAKIQWEIKHVGETEFIPIDESDRRLSDNGFILTLSSEDIYQKATFNCFLNY